MENHRDDALPPCDSVHANPPPAAAARLLGSSTLSAGTAAPPAVAGLYSSMYTGSAQPAAPGAVAGRALSPTRTTTTFDGRNAACGIVPVGEGVTLGVGVTDAV